MARPRKARTLESLPAPAIYIPAGWTQQQTAPVEIAIEDFEIMRLTDGHGYTIEEAAKKVGVSRSTAGRMLERARRALALGIEKRAPVYLDASEDLVLAPPQVDSSLAFDTQDAPHSNRLAVACPSIDLDTPIERIFGRASAFAIVSPDSSLTLIKNPGANIKRFAARLAVKTLKSHGVSRVVAGRFGPEAIKALAEAGIQPLVANGFKLGQSIALFKHQTHDTPTK